MSFRRRNKSAKVPNVKLRPADAGAVAKSKARLAQNNISTAWAQDSDDGELEGDSNINDHCPRPFKGLIVCATGLSDKTSLFKNAVELGALALHDLTDRVTHLIAEECGSAKYHCAVERKIPVMGASWIRECYQTWLKGDDVDLAASVKTHRLPIFSGVTLCVSGIEDISLRTKINKLVTSQGGKYAKALERPIKVTHLLCSGDTQTDKMRYAQKFNQAGEANIYLVWEEWFWDCLEFGGRFDEEKYSVSQPRPQRKLGANAAPMMEMPQPSSAPMSSSIPPSTARSAHGRALDDPFVAAPTVDDDDELVSVRRVPAETLQVWASVLQPRGFVLSNGRLARSPSKSQANQSVASTSPCPPGPLPVRAQTLHDLPVQKMSSLANFSRVRSFAPVSKDISTPKNLFKRAGSKAGEDISSFLGGIRAREDAELADAANLGDDANADAPRALLAPTTAAQNAQAGPSRSRPFSGFKFVTHGETDCNSVHVAIEKCGGEVIKNKEAAPDFILVRLASGSTLYQAETDPVKQSKYRTECWLERCAFVERICTPDEHPSFAPLPVSAMPVPGADKVVLSLSGLDTSELCWTKRLAKALGIVMATNFSRRTTHLLCPSGQGAKFDKAGEWQIPVVGNAWLAEMIQLGAIPTTNGFLIGAGGVQIPPERLPELSLSVDVNALLRPDKGKLKQTESLGGMSDITNGSRSRAPSRQPTAMSRKGTPSQLLLDDEHEEEQPEQHGHEDWSFGVPNGLLSGPLGSIQSQHSSPEPDIDPSTPPPPSSSNAPSPMQRERTRSVTPSQSSSQARRALEMQRSLADLLVLGKRPTEEEPEDDFLRPGKRTRQLTKTRSGSATADPVRLSPPSYDPYEGLNSSLVNKYVQDAHIIYQDPNQALEQARLLRYRGPSGQGSPPGLGGPKPPIGPDGTRRTKLVKRAARKPGF